MYRVKFTAESQAEFEKLDGSVKPQVLRAIERRAESPIVPSARLSGGNGLLFRIKFRGAGLRIIYEVIDDEVVILVLKIGRRDEKNLYVVR